MGDMHGINQVHGTREMHDTNEVYDTSGMHGFGNEADSNLDGHAVSNNMDDILQDDAAGDNPAGVTGDLSGPPPEAEANHGDGQPTLVPITALMDERRKRKAAEARVGQLGEGQDGRSEHRDDEGYATTTPLGQQAEIARFVEGEGVALDHTEAAARNRYPDFDRNVDAFEQLAQHQPQLVSAMREAPDPGEYAYRVGQQLVNHQLAGQPASPNPGGLPDASGYGGSRAATGYGLGAGGAAQAAFGSGPTFGSGRRHLSPLPESLSGVQSATDHHNTRGWRPTPLEDILGA